MAIPRGEEDSALLREIHPVSEPESPERQQWPEIELASVDREQSPHTDALPDLEQSLETEVAGNGENNDHLVEEVRLTVPITDEPDLPTLTFRVWVLGIPTCVVVAALNQLFAYRESNVLIDSTTVNFLVFPLGKFLAATLPNRQYQVPFTNWSFCMNPGPFNMKEHILIWMFAKCGTVGARAVLFITASKTFFHRDIDPITAMLLVLTSELVGYGWAGLFRNVLVESPQMWWPGCMSDVTLFRTLHEVENRRKGGLKKWQIFMIIFIIGFSYHTIPRFFPFLSTISVICLLWKKSITAQQIGSGVNGLGFGSFGLDWSTISGYLGSPLETPFSTIANVCAGFMLFFCAILPYFYWRNEYYANNFPILSEKTFDRSGQIYDLKRIIDPRNFDINLQEYNKHGKAYLSISFALEYGLRFAVITAIISHIALFERTTIRQWWGNANVGVEDNHTDVHNLLMKNYQSVPLSWFISVLTVSVSLSLFVVGRLLQYPWWGLLEAWLIPFFFTLLIGIIKATTNVQIGLNIIINLIIGQLNPGKPLANAVFKIYGNAASTGALGFMQDLKLGQYLKIPPRHMFIAQLIGTILASIIFSGTSSYLLTSIEYICQPELLPDGSSWTCPGENVYVNSLIIWDIIRPRRMFSMEGVYTNWYVFFVIGFVAPILVWVVSLVFPRQKWISYINIPLVLSSYSLPAKPVNYICWIAVGLFFNGYIFRWHKKWWGKHNYLLSIGLNVSVATMAMLVYFTLDPKGPSLWGSEASDYCPLARCPTAHNIKVSGCPVETT